MRILSFLCVMYFASTTIAPTAMAAANCPSPAQTYDGSGDITAGLIGDPNSGGTGSCTRFAATAEFNTPAPNSGFKLKFAVAGGTCFFGRAQIHPRSSTGASIRPTNIICTNCDSTDPADTNINSAQNMVIANGASSAFSFSYAPSVGTTISVSGTLSRAANQCKFENVIVSGGGFGALPVTGPTTQQTQHTIANFMSRRADQITANDPDIARRLNIGGNNGAGGNGNAVNFTANGTGSNNQASLSTSLRQVARAAKANKDKRGAELGGMMGLGSQPLNGTSVSNGFDVWVEGKWVKIDSDTTESNLGLLYVGADYRFSSALLIGVLGQFDWTDEEDDTNNTDVDGRGWMVGPYIAARLHDNLIFDGRAAWGRSNNDISPDRTYTDSFETKRWLVKGQLTGDFDQGVWHFAPHVGIIYFKEDQEGYTDSNGLAIGSQTVSLGRVTFGPKVSISFKAGGGMVVSPHLGIKGIWDFDKADVVDVATGIASGSNDLRARIESGLTIQMPGGLSLSGEGFYDGIGADDFSAYGGSAKLRVPLN